MKNKFNRMKIGQIISIKKRLSTKEIERINQNTWLVHCFTDGWQINKYNLNQLINYLKK